MSEQNTTPLPPEVQEMIYQLKNAPASRMATVMEQAAKMLEATARRAQEAETKYETAISARTVDDTRLRNDRERQTYSQGFDRGKAAAEAQLAAVAQVRDAMQEAAKESHEHGFGRSRSIFTSAVERWADALTKALTPDAIRQECR